jgi:hypothetical protein
MWMPSKVVDWFTGLKADADLNAQVAKEALTSLREELATVRGERDTLKIQVVTNEVHLDWMRTKVNQLEYERAQLIRIAYNIDIPVPELVKQPVKEELFKNFSFDDIGDTRAKALGLPTYDN